MLPLYVATILLTTIPSIAPQAQLSCSIGKKSERAEYVDKNKIRNMNQPYQMTRVLCRNLGNCVDWANSPSDCMAKCKRNKECCHWFYNANGSLVG